MGKYKIGYNIPQAFYDN